MIRIGIRAWLVGLVTLGYACVLLAQEPPTTRVDAASPQTYSAPAGAAVPITLNWYRIPMDADYLQFMHLVNTAGQSWSVDDQGTTSATWAAGAFAQIRSIALPPTLPAGSYDVRVGLAGGSPWTNRTLVMGAGVTDPSGDQRYKVGTLTVTDSTTPPTTRVDAASPQTYNAAAGAAVPITLNWYRIPMDADYLQFMHLVNAAGQSWSVDDQGTASATWAAGAFVQTRSIALPPTLPAGSYDIRVGLAGGSPWTNRTLVMGAGITDPSGDQRYKVGTLTVTDSTTPPTTRVDAASPQTYSAAAGATVPITLNWYRIPMDADYLQFMHLVNAAGQSCRSTTKAPPRPPGPPEPSSRPARSPFPPRCPPAPTTFASGWPAEAHGRIGRWSWGQASPIRAATSATRWERSRSRPGAKHRRSPRHPPPAQPSAWPTATTSTPPMPTATRSATRSPPPPAA